jgi:very-short-patch-repair endonuclease
MTKYNFLEKAKNIHGYKYNYLDIPNKIKLSDKISIEFNGLIFTQSVSKHLAGKCPEKKVNRKTNAEFIIECKKVWGNKYDYSLVDYKGSLENIKIIYNSITYEQRASSHLNGMSPEFRKTEESIIQNNILSSESIGENEISKFLDKFKIVFTKKYKLGNIEYDFYIPSMRTSVEFDGIQHFQPVDHLGGLQAYELLRVNDKIKSDYCEREYINLIRIRYDQIENIYQILWDNLGVHIKLSKKK